MADLIKKLNSVRGGHKSYVTKLLTTIENCKKEPEKYLSTLNEKKCILNAISSQIVDQLTNDNEILREIESHSTYMESLEDLVIQLKACRTGHVDTAPTSTSRGKLM